ncbi:MAG TPA: trimeric intracellular cation channel family protein [Leeuwenhoekiella sp.]|nr:trimeric intracellular cation channel family protein [Leeuwenhoekiella sp.]
MTDLNEIIDVLGTIAFAISGVLAALKKRLDFFGILIIAAVTSVGGGTLRDVLIGKTPVTWMLNISFVYLILATVVLAVIFRKQLKYLRRSLFLFDTIGIALYTVTGVEIGLRVGLNPAICVAVGTMTACFGGVLRDILCTEIPIIFRKEIYASACIIGGLVYVILDYYRVYPEFIAIISGFTVILIRTAAVIFEIKLPNIYGKEDKK